MKRFAGAAAALAASTSLATAGGLDRSGQSVLAIFDDPNTYSFSLGYVQPSVTGSDSNGNVGSYDAGNSYTQLGLSYTNDINDRLSYTVIYDQPFGADIFYNGDPAASNLAGTRADLTSDAISILGKFQMNERFSVFGGLRVQRAGGRVSLNGQAYGNALATAGVAAGAGTTAQILGGALQGDPNAIAALPPGVAGLLPTLGAQVQGASAGFTANGGYDVRLSEEWGVGLTAGVAYEIPDIALRAVLTYHSEITHDANSTETLAIGAAAAAGAIAGTTTFSSPQSVNLEFQTGIAKDTLLLASMRWTDWDDFDVIPPTLGQDLANIDDSYRWNIGVARRFNENLVGSISVTYEKDNGSATVSPLGPNDGQIGLTVGGRYQKDNLTVTGGINYTKLGDAFAGVASQPVALFEGNSAVGVGFKVNYKF
ncbi:long-subunit fatty acid transport protein [Litoreibacter ponti]|uniref:Long-subunit fatty acid transport protein n=1 Tax=Litoreibacter ponti TaxID=1510457 RepID=A0A2T6BIB2_9RHOB|nr:outer membrane protein transport protein [Litoreibacter ponti]PTX55792.1 long-subunit fatty acid transport protein [Litoreibacter ponti]